MVCIIMKDGSKNVILGDQLRFGEDGNLYVLLGDKLQVGEDGKVSVMQGETCTGFFRMEDVNQAYVTQRK